MKLLKTALIACALGATLALAGCTACDSASSAISSEISSMESSMSSLDESIMSSEPDSSSDSSMMDESSSMMDETSSMVPTLGTDFAEIGALDGDPVTWGPGRQVDDQNRPIACMELQQRFGKYNCYFIGEAAKKIYLTFDEGYENGFTPQILDILNEKNVKAVFFVTMDYVKREPELIQRMIDEGHIVGNHSTKHPVNGYPSLPLDAVQEDLITLHDYVKENFQYDMSLFRYPAGIFNEQDVALISKIGYRQVFWSFAYADWNPDEQPDTAKAFERVSGAAHDGAIYLLHAVSKTNVDILPGVIDKLRADGYEFVLFPGNGQA